MKRRLLPALSFLLFLCLYDDCRGQGFDWQYSVRTPMSSPVRFLGVDAGMGAALHMGTLPYVEAVPCCSFDHGTGSVLWIGMVMERWNEDDLAFSGSVGYRRVTGGFTSAFDTLPRRDMAPLLTQYEYDVSLHMAYATGGVRYRILGTHLTAGAMVRLTALVGSTTALRDRVVAPAGDRFPNGSTVQELPAGPLGSLATVGVSVGLSLGYDIGIGTGSYLSPAVVFGLPVTDATTDASWRFLDVSVGIRYLRAF